jgi:tight adherence protein C
MLRTRRCVNWSSAQTLPDAVLAASVSLAGTEGAKVRASLAAKAASLRTHELAEAETADQAATERMSLPVVLLFAGFLVFLGYPAVEKVLTGLG